MQDSTTKDCSSVLQTALRLSHIQNKIYNILNFIIISPLTELWSYTSYTPALLVAGAAGASSSAREVRAFRELTRGEARGTRTRAIEDAVMAG